LIKNVEANRIGKAAVGNRGVTFVKRISGFGVVCFFLGKEMCLLFIHNKKFKKNTKSQKVK